MKQKSTKTVAGHLKAFYWKGIAIIQMSEDEIMDQNSSKRNAEDGASSKGS